MLVGHLYHWQTLGVHHLVFLDDIIPVEHQRSQLVDLIRLERPLSVQRHTAVDVIPNCSRIGERIPRIRPRFLNKQVE